ncbi:MAG TPA: class I SAM-dependent methyltransferase [Candidatus Limnocylindrales bacterium]|nr:class I SAM-dependent methyltransferase [Candidatus Limnocylindrales bacterium]
MIDSAQRFSSRVENYIKYRPGYPAAILDLLKEKCGLTCRSVVADIGSGTGILTELFLRNGNRVFAVEPNRNMREAAERRLGQYPNLTSVSGTAETSTLKDQSVDFITASQAFHWFDRKQSRREFLRILKPGGWTVLIWNERVIASPFARAYEHLLRTYGTDYEDVNHKHTDAKVIGPFFGTNGHEQADFPNRQVLNGDELKGRLLSSSYAPEPGHPRHVPMMEALNTLFSEHQSDGKVVFEYDTLVYYGQLSA